MSSINIPSPPKTPTNLTALPGSYKLRALLAIFSILLFFVLYVSLMFVLGYLVYWAIFYNMIHINKITLLLKAGAIAGSVMLFVFTLKFIFSLRNEKAVNRIKLKESDHPNLFEFVNRICEETGAPKPKNIYVDPDVNAYVAYSNNWLSLILPVKKELTLGLGLVSCLNLTEFKAVTAHEFGHFAQSTMKIGSYIMSANTIIHNMIFTRDKWDNLLEQWRASDIRMSAAAWVITPIIWAIRKLLSLFYSLLNMMYSSLSREMEFNADKVAVSVTGSQAIVSALWKLDGGSEKWNNTINHAYLAAQKQLFTKNLYEHNTLALERSSEKQQTALNDLPMDQRGGKRFFSSDENSKVGMYSSHPPNAHREENAKTPFVDNQEDLRSPWLLFSNPSQIQEQMSTLVYEKYLNKKPSAPVPATEFEAFIKAETHGSELQEAYHNTFIDRFLHIPEKEELTAPAITTHSHRELITALKMELTDLMKPVEKIQSLMTKAQQIAEGTTTEKSFSYGGVSYGKNELESGYNLLMVKREELFDKHFKSWDIAFCSLHLALARHAQLENQLAKLYTQHNTLNAIYKKLVATRNGISTELQKIQDRDDLTQSEVNDFGKKVNNSMINLNPTIDTLDHQNFVPLPNIQTVQELKQAITEGGAFRKETGPIFENGGFERIGNNLETAIMHCQRLDQKSIAAILLLHEEIIEANDKTATQ